MWVAFAKNISAYAIFNDQSFNDTLTNISFEQLGSNYMSSNVRNRTSRPVHPMKIQFSLRVWQSD